MSKLTMAERMYDDWALNSDVCQECNERFYHGEPCGCPEEDEEDESE